MSAPFNQIINNNTKYINTHKGGKNDDDTKTFKEQQNLIKNINKTQKTNIDTRDLNNTLYRINDSKTIIDNNNLSNPIIYPEQSDLYFDNYLHGKNLKSIDSRVIQTYNYINIDSQIVQNNITTKYYELEENPLMLENETNFLTIQLNANIIKNFNIGDKISLQGLTPLKKNVKNATFTFTTGSNIVETDLSFDTLYSTKFQKLLIEFDNITFSSPYFYNISIISLNNTFECIINNGTLKFSIPNTFYSSNINENFTSNCIVRYQFYGNIPVNTINAYEPLGKLNSLSYHSIVEVSKTNIKISLSTITNLKISKLFFGGKAILIGNISETYINSNYEYLYNFNKKYFNIASFRIKSSELNIFSTNNETISINLLKNKFFWSIFDDGTKIYETSLNLGNYTYEDLQISLQKKINDTLQLTNPYRYVNVYFQPKLLLFNFTFYVKKPSPKCLMELIDNGNNIFTIKIFDLKHSLKVGNMIEITDSIDYYYISKNDINTRHTITNAYENYYEIKITNINIINDVGNTYGGYKIKILYNISAQIHMDSENSIGNLLFFKGVGLSYAITIFSNSLNDYTLSNQENYLYSNFKTINIISEVSNLNSSYVLLKIEKLNSCVNPYNQNFCYKFQIQKTFLNNTLFNTFVDNPLYFNPPLEELDKLKLSFISPQGEPINFKLFNYSMTLEMITITNASENTGLNLQLGRI